MLSTLQRYRGEVEVGGDVDRGHTRRTDRLGGVDRKYLAVRDRRAHNRKMQFPLDMAIGEVVAFPHEESGVLDAFNGTACNGGYHCHGLNLPARHPGLLSEVSWRVRRGF